MRGKRIARSDSDRAWLVDIVVFTGEVKNEKAIFLDKRRITQPETVFEVTVDQRPARAGIDPYNKLIDRNPDDNLVKVNKLD